MRLQHSSVFKNLSTSILDRLLAYAISGIGSSATPLEGLHQGAANSEQRKLQVRLYHVLFDCLKLLLDSPPQHSKYPPGQACTEGLNSFSKTRAPRNCMSWSTPNYT